MRTLAPLVLLLLLGACALPSSVAVDVDLEPVAFHGDLLPVTTRHEDEFEATDGARLGYVVYRCSEPRAALVYLHGIESHGGWFRAAADGFCGRGYDVFCLDRRGSGINRENRGFTSGHVDGYETLLSDIETFVRPLRERYDHVFLIGLSWGGKLALAYGLDRPQDVDGLILITPGLLALVDLGLLDKLGVFFCAWLVPRAQFRTPIEPEMFTETPEYLEKIREDPLRLRRASARFFWQSLRLDRFVADHIEKNRRPTLLFLAGNDRIIDNEGVVELLERGSAGGLEIMRYADQTHSIQFDATDRLVRDTAAWLEGQMTECERTSESGH